MYHGWTEPPERIEARKRRILSTYKPARRHWLVDAALAGAAILGSWLVSAALAFLLVG